MEQWLLAAKQKEEDKLIMERYKRADDIKIKEMNLEIEKVSTQKTFLENSLENELTETQALQIEIDKMGEEFKD